MTIADISVFNLIFTYSHHNNSYINSNTLALNIHKLQIEKANRDGKCCERKVETQKCRYQKNIYKVNDKNSCRLWKKFQICYVLPTSHKWEDCESNYVIMLLWTLLLIYCILLLLRPKLDWLEFFFFRAVLFQFLATLTWKLLCLKVYMMFFYCLVPASFILNLNVDFFSSFSSFDRLLYLWWFTDDSSSGRMCQVDCI